MKYFLNFLAIALAVSSYAQNESYQVNVNLLKVENDRINVVIQTPEVDTDTIEYHMPKIVPGTYSISDFGRFVSDFIVKDSAGNLLPVEQLTVNRWQIANAKSMTEISYWVDDTFDQAEGYGDNIVFEPGGTNIEADRDCFVLNTFGVVGYLDGEKFRKFELTVKRPERLFGATALKRSSSTSTTDTFVADNYNFLADGPIMYSVPDTVTRTIAGAEILISVFSPNNVLSAEEVMDNIFDLMEAQAEYLGGDLPVDRYAYLIYLLDYNSLSGAMGALEHSYSSLYALPEASVDVIGQTVRDVAAHEFLHIVTPLNIHSEQIHDFNYIDPEMSEHLWLYEGVTEYSSMHVQVRSGLYDGETFLDEVRDKLNVSDRYPRDLAFTEMSKRILEEEYEPMYSNVYHKGALIGLCLDLYLLKYSDLELDLPKLMQALAKTYGPKKAFKDSELLSEIANMTYEEIGEFLTTYVSGNTPLPVQDCLAWAGITYEPEEIVSVTTLGNIGLDLDEDQKIYISSTDQMNEFGEAMGFETYDKILEVNGMVFDISAANEILSQVRYETPAGKKIKMTVSRLVDGETKEIKLKAKSVRIDSIEKHKLTFSTDPTEDQLKIRKAWLGAGAP